MECREVLEEQESLTASSVCVPGGKKGEFEDLSVPPPSKMASTDSHGFAQTTISAEDEPQQKRRKITMDPGACLEYSNSEVGANPLKNPLSVKKSSRNINDILMPRSPRGDRKVPKSSGRVFTNTRFRTASTFPSAKPRGNSTQNGNLAMKRLKDSTMDSYFIQDSRNPKVPCTSSPDKDAQSMKTQNLKRPVTQKTSTVTTACLQTPPKNSVPFSMSSPRASSQRVSPGSLRVSPGSRVFKWPAKKSSVAITTSPDATTHVFVSSPDKGTVSSSSWSQSSTESSTSGQMSTSNSSSPSLGHVVRNIFGKAAADTSCSSKDGAAEMTSPRPQVEGATEEDPPLPSLDDSELDKLLANYDMDHGCFTIECTYLFFHMLPVDKKVYIRYYCF